MISLRQRVLGSVDDLLIPEEEKDRLQHYTIFLLLGIPAMLFFGIYHLSQSRYLLAALILISCSGIIAGWYLLRRMTNGIVVYRVNSGLFCVLILYLLVVGGEGGAKILWMYTSPLIAFFLLSKREGLFWSAGIYFIALVLLWQPFTLFPVYPYSVEFKIRFSITFLMVSAITCWFDFLRHSYRMGMQREHQKLEQEKIRLQHEIEVRRRTERENTLLISQLRHALEEVKTLSGFIPICAHCKKIRDDEGFWERLDAYIQKHSDAKFSHSICPECLKKLYPEL